MEEKLTSILFSSNGEIYFEIETGKVTFIQDDGDPCPHFSDIVKIDVEEYKRYYNIDTIPIAGLDILDVGFWHKDSSYTPPDQSWRDEFNIK